MRTTEETVKYSGNASIVVPVVEVREDTSVSVGRHRANVRVGRWLTDD